MPKFEIITPINTYEDLQAKVEANQGIFTINMRRLRDIQGADRLGRYVKSMISRELAGRGLNHQPKNLPNRQERLVRIFKKESPVASVITAVLAVKSQNDAVIRRAADAATRSA
jgi:hypothetical protein